MKTFRPIFIFFILPGFFWPGLNLFAQKPIIDSSVYGKWESIVNEAQISNDGKYVAYRIKNHPAGVTALVIQSCDAKWRLEIPEGGRLMFLRNSKQVIYSLLGDSLALLALGTTKVEYLQHIGSFELLRSGNDEWLIYSVTDGTKRTFLRNTITGASRIVDGVEAISTNGNRINILVQSKSADSGYILKWVNLSSDTVYTVWMGDRPENFVFNPSGTELAFSVKTGLKGDPDRSFWRFQSRTGKLQKLIDNQLFADSGLVLDRIRRFSEDGSKLFFSFKEKMIVRSMPRDTVSLVVWNYKDTRLQSMQERQLSPRTYIGVISTITLMVKRLEFQNEYNWMFEIGIRGRNDVVLIDHRNIDLDEDERRWYGASTGVEYLVLTGSGERIPIASLDGSKVDFRLSPDEKFVLFYDSDRRSYFSYEIKSRKFRNITKEIPTNWESNEEEYPKGNFVSKFSGWLLGGRYVLLHDAYDLWRVDLLAGDRPGNITNGYGKRNQIVFRPLFANDDNTTISDSSKIILSSFNKLTKDNGFYNVTLGQHSDPKLLTMGPYMYYAPGNDFEARGITPVKAMNCNSYIVSRMNCKESPNFFITSDFKTFTQLSDVHPEKGYNWMTSELLTWKAVNGRNYQGVLYKPDNFDPEKKYPIIFYYYERKSDMKNVYLEPEASTGHINIPDYVSKGYLVATPDIHYTIGKTGESALNAVVSVARYLSKRPWVDAGKMGIQGMSFGGYETNYIVTHSHLFAAACSAAGLSDLVSNYGWLTPWGPTLQAFHEFGQLRIGRPLSDNFNIYIQNSPLFYTKNVTTPFLMMHTKKDGACPFANIMEFYALLRRLGKKVWLLQYDDGFHGVEGKAAIDYTIRMQQFFDHFLKGFPEPTWMSKGIPARLRGFENGLELDNSKNGIQ